MSRFLLIFCFGIGLVFSHFWVSSALADDNTCWIQGSEQDDVWVIIHDADGDGNRRQVLWEGKIAAGQKIKIESTDGFIRYDYKSDPNQPYEGDISVGCTGDQTFLVE